MKNNYFIEGKVIGTSGKELDGYYNFIRIFDRINESDLNKLVLINKEYFYKTNIVGIELFGALFSTYLLGLDKYYCNLSFLLKERKHGNKERFYGYINQNLKTYFLDDVITTGKTFSEFIDYANIHEGFKVDNILCLKNRSNLLEINGINIIELKLID